MKRLILLLIVAACASAQQIQTTESPSAKSPAVKSDVERAGLRGHIRTVLTDTEPQGKGRSYSSPWIRQDTYSHDGWLINSVRMVNGEQVFHGVWQRDGSRLIRTDFEIRERPDPRNEITTYDTQGRPIEKLVYNSDGSLRERTIRRYEERGTVETTCDGNGRVIDSYLRHTRTTQSGNSTVSETYTDKELESRIVVQQNDERTSRRTQNFGRDGRVSSASAEESDGRTTNFALDTKHENGLAGSRDSSGHLKVQTVYDNNYRCDEMRPDLRASTCDDLRRHRLVTKSYYATGGREIRLESYLDGKLIRTEVHSYEDDGSGNWIRMTVTTDEAGQTSVTEIVTRTITYY
jgi:hypothetical protein